MAKNLLIAVIILFIILVVVMTSLYFAFRSKEVESPQGLVYKVYQNEETTSTDCQIENAGIETGEAVDLAKSAGIEQGTREVGVKYFLLLDECTWEITNNFKEGDQVGYCQAYVNDETREAYNFKCSDPIDTL